ncbi:MAG: ribonuclease H-like domain-containing protein [candidate division WOR-3 bacterium]|nr:ribonuclease H-like domain-containing protein [candidate division WOR-3 bacterium]MCX7947518.1 ribonuclease H-like domain-containing protein [candidate division WOR-3 bacterium]MDW8150404.1 ribonuclease H-like domain-containing protein [candidate division WOR-3 bacterium]
MIKYKAQNNLIVWKLELPIFIDSGSIIDIETNGYNEIIAFGYISKNVLVSVLRTKNTDYDQFLNQIYKKLKKLEKPFYGYNTDFEIKFLGYKDSWIDLMGIHKKLSKIKKTKFPKLKELSPSSYLEYYNINLDIPNSEIPTHWRNYLIKQDESLLETIIRHNIMDLISELHLLITHGFIKSELKL